MQTRRSNQWITEMYPELLTKTYFCPPVQFSRFNPEEKNFAGLPIEVFPEPRNESTKPGNKRISSGSRKKAPSLQDMNFIREEHACARVLSCLRDLAEDLNEVMMVVSPVKYGPCKNKSVLLDIARVQHCHNLPKRQHQGDVDVLIIHRDKGLIIGEIKSVGDNFSILETMTAERKDTAVREKVTTALKQLRKSEEVLIEIVSDLKGVSIQKTLMVPNLATEQLTRALVKEEELCQCLGVKHLKEALKLCMTSETFEAKKHAVRWWQQLTNNSTTSTHFYRELVDRFCGPKTITELYVVTPPRLEFRTEGEAVVETGNRLASIRLLRSQFDLLNLPDTSTPHHPHISLMFLTGPPGTGKTIVLTLKGLRWLQEGFTVYVVSTWYKSPPSSFLIEHQLKEMFEKVKGTVSEWSTKKPDVHRVHYDFSREEEMSRAVEELSSIAKQNQLCIIMDEPGPDVREDAFKLFDKHAGSFKKHLSKNEGLGLLKKLFYLSEIEAEKRFRESLMNNQKLKSTFSLGDFQNVYSTLKKEKIETHDVVEIFKKYSGDSERILAETEAMELMREEFSLSKEDAKTEGGLSLVQFQQLYIELRTENIKENAFNVFCKKLIKKVTSLRLWAASIENNSIPDQFQKHSLRTQLRSPQAVMREVCCSPLMKKGKTIDPYEQSKLPYNPDGLPVKKIFHRNNSAHNQNTLPHDCKRCGEEIAKILQDLKVGKKDTTKSLQYRDVLVICAESVSGQSGLAFALKNKFPVRVVEEVAGDDAIRDTAIAKTNKVTVTHYLHVQGLERKVVVFAGDLTWTNNYWRLTDISRCTSQLVLIDPDNAGHSGANDYHYQSASVSQKPRELLARTKCTKQPSNHCRSPNRESAHTHSPRRESRHPRSPSRDPKYLRSPSRASKRPRLPSRDPKQPRSPGRESKRPHSHSRESKRPR